MITKQSNIKKSMPAILGGIPAFKVPIPITKPTMPVSKIIKYRYSKILKNGMITNSIYVKEFEKKIEKYLGVKNVVAVGSCTSGLMLTIKALGLKGEIILPSFTFHATAHAIVWNGVTPVFVDCDPNTYNISVDTIEKSITKNTSAIIGVHIFGNPCNISGLKKLSKSRKLSLLFDSAHAFGSKHNGKKIGCFGDAEIFSLSPTKLLTSGEGGIVATNNDYLANKLRVARNYGDSGDYNCQFSGFNSRMSEFHSILGIESLKELETNLNKRKKIVALYKKLLSVLPGICFQRIAPYNESTFKDFSITVNEKKFGMSRDLLFDALVKEGIIVKKYFDPPVHKQIAFANYLKRKKKNAFVNTNYIADHIFSLPLYSHIKESDVKKICFTIKKIYSYRTSI